MPNKKWIAHAANFMAIAVIIGAFSAHYLKKIAEPESIEAIKTAVLYLIVHSLALLFISLIYGKFNDKVLKKIALLFHLGIYLFSFSIILTTVLKIFGIQYAFIEILHITPPIGGVCFIIAWLLLCMKMFAPHKPKH